MKTLYKCINEYQDNLKRFKDNYSIMHFLMNQEYDEILDFVLKEEAICVRLGALVLKS